jgi:6-phosphogluconolactonase (cycloisomerase 2 family)
MSNRFRCGARRSRSELSAAWVAVLGVIAGVPVAACSAAAAGAARGPFVYVADSKRDAISQFKLRTSGALLPLEPAKVASGAFPYGIAVNPQGTSVYAVDVGATGQPANKVSQYTIDPSTGRLRPKSPATVPGGRGGQSIVISPNGKSAYVNGQHKVWQYTIDPRTGRLRPMSPATVASGGNETAIALTPNGKHLYVATCGGCGYALRKTPPRAGSSASASTSTVKSAIWEYRINPSTGALSAKPFGIVAIGSAPQWMAIAPNGRSAYLAAPGGGRGGPASEAVWQYSINQTTGRLTPKSPAAAAVGFDPHDVVIAPNGKNAYVITVDDSKVTQYRINERTGTLSPQPISTATTVPVPEAIALAADGQSAYVTSEGAHDLSQFAINPTTGKITPMTPATVKTASVRSAWR